MTRVSNWAGGILAHDVVHPGRVDFGVGAQRERARLDDEVVDAQLELRGPLLILAAHVRGPSAFFNVTALAIKAL